MPILFTLTTSGNWLWGPFMHTRYRCWVYDIQVWSIICYSWWIWESSCRFVLTNNAYRQTDTNSCLDSWRILVWTTGVIPSLRSALLPFSGDAGIPSKHGSYTFGDSIVPVAVQHYKWATMWLVRQIHHEPMVVSVEKLGFLVPSTQIAVATIAKTYNARGRIVVYKVSTSFGHHGRAKCGSFVSPIRLIGGVWQGAASLRRWWFDHNGMWWHWTMADTIASIATLYSRSDVSSLSCWVMHTRTRVSSYPNDDENERNRKLLESFGWHKHIWSSTTIKSFSAENYRNMQHLGMRMLWTKYDATSEDYAKSSRQTPF